MELAAASQGLSLMSKVLGEERGVPKFGIGDPAAEEQCSVVHVFMTLQGRTTTEMQRGDFLPTATPASLLLAFQKERGKETTQRILQDENGFTLSEQLSNANLTCLSSRCCLNLSFVYERAHSNGLAGGFAKATGATVDEGKNAVNSALSYFRGSGKPSETTSTA
jgi:hypothetical protein